MKKQFKARQSASTEKKANDTSGDKGEKPSAASNGNRNGLRNDQIKQRQRRPKNSRDPNAPARPLNGYVRYLNANRERIRLEHPDLAFADVTKRLAEQWRYEVTDSVKREYNEAAERDKERYIRELTEYKKSDSFRFVTCF